MKEKNRILSIDILRGIAMILMVLDHTRDFWNAGNGINPTDIINTTAVLFFTRWVTHFCAPIFIVLTGISVYLSKKNNSKSNKSSFLLLLKRGLFLIILEITVISVIWEHIIFINGIMLQVIWVIGVSMLILSVLQFFPSRYIGLSGLIIMIFHNLIPDFYVSENITRLLISVLHQSNVIRISSQYEIMVLYPLIPWVGVMAFGYGLGEIFTWEKPERGKFLKITGILFILLFIILRLLNIYGDPIKFQIQKSFIFTVISFLNLEKYPPSFLYLLMTMGPLFLLLSYLEKFKPKDSHPLIIFGRTPLFFYIVHLYLIMITSIVSLIVLNLLHIINGYNNIPFRFSLIITYIIWSILLILLYPICKYYYNLKFIKKLKWTAYF